MRIYWFLLILILAGFATVFVFNINQSIPSKCLIKSARQGINIQQTYVYQKEHANTALNDKSFGVDRNYPAITSKT
ncbi:hypothetical protein [Facilibium subflavum]|uniref:hypothetical protein n=1 Tax=Facilibium subflavum TaxID=2219058 RepID=UPI000E64B8CC|nr:hypothetical protein [Facilibium subflavum]